MKKLPKFRVHAGTPWASKTLAVWLVTAFVTAIMLVNSATVGFAADDEEPNQLFDSVYGDAYKAALASTNKNDDIELAKQLRDAVTQFDLPKSLIAVIGDRVCTLAERAPEAHLAATQTIDKVIETSPERKQFANARLIAVLSKAYAFGRVGDEVLRDSAGKALLARLTTSINDRMAAKKPVPPDLLEEAIRVARVIDPRQVADLEAQRDKASEVSKAAAMIDSLEKKLDADPTDADTRKKLINIHLIERDAPDAAIWFNGEGLDETTRAMLPLAAKDGVGASPKALSDLATWYMQNGDDADKEFKAKMYRRSKKYFGRFLAEYDQNDLLKAKATLSVAKLDNLLKLYESQPNVTASNNPLLPPKRTDSGSSDVGKLTVEIKGETITEADRVERMFSQYARMLGREYVKAGDDFLAINHIDYSKSYASSRKETVAAVTKRLTRVEVQRSGIITRRQLIKPVPGEAQAVAMALPDIQPGKYGYIHSAEVTKILGSEEMLVKEMWLVDYDTIRATDSKDREQRYRLYRQQRDFSRKLIRIVGHDTTGLTVGQRVGMTGTRGKPLQLAIVKLEDNPEEDYYNKTITVAVVVDRIENNRVGEDGFAEVAAKRGLTKTDVVNIVFEARRDSFKDYVERSIKRIEARGARLD